jgi:hypothetical protein
LIRNLRLEREQLESGRRLPPPITKLEWEEALAQREAAGVARWLIENREELLQQSSRTLEVRAVPEFPGK